MEFCWYGYPPAKVKLKVEIENCPHVKVKLKVEIENCPPSKIKLKQGN